MLLGVFGLRGSTAHLHHKHMRVDAPAFQCMGQGPKAASRVFMMGVK